MFIYKDLGGTNLRFEVSITEAIASAERKSILGIEGIAPSWVQRQRPLVRGKVPLQLKGFRFSTSNESCKIYPIDCNLHLAYVVFDY